MITRRSSCFSLSPAHPQPYRRLCSISMRLLLICTVLVLSVLPHSGEAHISATDDDSLGYNRPDWMGELPDDTPLSQLAVPGTHDTMAYSGTILGFGQCQSVSLNKQLNGGIRALDIRCKNQAILVIRNGQPVTEYKLKCHHGSLYLNANFDDVMDTCVSFLEANPTESIFMKVAEEDSETPTVFQDTLLKYLDSYPQEFIWKTNDWTQLPLLGDVRGKIVIIDSFPTVLPRCGYPWGATFDRADPAHIKVIGIAESYNKQWNAIKEHLIKANEERNSSIKGFATHLSDYAYPITPWDVADAYDRWPRDDIDGMNRRTYWYLRDLLDEGVYHRIGWVMMDFPGKGLIDNIVAHNRLDRKLANDPPVADAGGPYEAGEGTAILLDGSGTFDFENHAIYYRWDIFADGVWDTARTQNPYAYYTAGDNFISSLRLVTDDSDKTSSDGTYMLITNVPPEVVIDDISSKIPGCIMPGHEVVVYGSFTDPGYQDTHLADWYFSGSGIAAGVITGENDPPDVTGMTQTTNSYPAAGIYPVTLVVTDDDNGTGWATVDVLVRTPAQVCRFMIEYIQSLESSAFSHPREQYRRTLCRKLEALEKTIDKRDANGTVRKLANDLRSTWDGEVHGRKESDWITDSDAQDLLCLTIDELILYLVPSAEITPVNQ